jgi:hypothetical protein
LLAKIRRVAGDLARQVTRPLELFLSLVKLGSRRPQALATILQGAIGSPQTRFGLVLARPSRSVILGPEARRLRRLLGLSGGFLRTSRFTPIIGLCHRSLSPQ